MRLDLLSSLLLLLLAGSVVAESARPAAKEAVALALSADAAATAEGSTVRMREPGSGKLVRTLEGHTGNVLALAFSPDGASLAGVSDGEVFLWKTRTGRGMRKLSLEVASTQPRLRGRSFVTFSPDGKKLALGTESRGVRLWDLARDAPVSLDLPVGGATAAAFSPDGKTLAVGTGLGGSHGSVGLYDAASGKRLEKGAYRYALYSDVLGVAFSGKGDRVLSGHMCGWVAWCHPAKPDVRMESQHELVSMKPDAVSAVVFSPGAGRVAMVTGNVLQVWETGSWIRLLTVAGVSGPVAFSPDGKDVAAFGAAGLRRWPVPPGQH